MKKISILYLFCIVMTMAAIYGFSAQNYENTMKTSDIIVQPIEETVIKSSQQVFETEKEEADYRSKIEAKLDKIVRKSAHGILFFVLGMFSALFFASIGMCGADVIMSALVLCFACACGDELHQRFVSGRDSKFGDVCIDVFGAWLATLLFYISFKIRSKHKGL